MDRWLRAPKSSDPAELFPLLSGTAVVDTLLWDGPTALDAFSLDWARISAEAASRKRHFFVIEPPELGRPVGCCDVRTDADRFRGDVGLWIGIPFQGKGFGTRTVRELVDYGFGQLGLTKIEAHVFVGNWASRRIFEKNGFALEGTIRAAVRKRGRPVDEWYLGLLRPAANHGSHS
jgi:RimJ/RimL family protein N-acetyltransferase